MDFEKIDVVLRVIAVFDELEIPYLIGGSFASSLYGIVRTTNDADIVAALKTEHVAPVFRALESEFYVDLLAIERAIKTGRSFNVIHSGTQFKVDVFTPGLTGFAIQQLERRQERPFGEGSRHKAYFASPEDTVLAKLEWYRRGNEVSDQQWRDVLTVIKVQRGRLDLDYMRRWAEELKVADLLEEALAETRPV
jgi:hypothetical protein